MMISSMGRQAISRRRALQAGGAALASLTFMPKGARAADELNLLVWCDHTGPGLLDPFAEKHGIKINTKEYDLPGVAYSILEQSQPGDWDVFVADTGDIMSAVSKGYLGELPDADMPWADIFPDLKQPDSHYKDGKLYAVPEKFGYNTIAFNNTKVTQEEASHAKVMWDPKFAGRIAIYDYYIPTMEMVAIGLGIKPQEITKMHLPAIKEKLVEMKKLSSLVGDVPTTQNALVTGAADIIVGGGEFAVAGLMAEKPELDWVLPNEGGVRWSQSIGIFADSTKKDLATEFVKYIVSPEGQGRLATADCYWAMPANSKANLDDDQKKRLRWDQQPGFIAKSYPYFFGDAELDAAMQEVWTEVLGA
jgi:spermidine/putrescine transport system substrate-binding protein